MDNVTLAAAVFAGAASFLSPCVLPMVPAYIGLMSGYSATEMEAGDVSLGRVVGTTSLFVAGFSLVFVVLLGGAATAIGQALRSPVFTTISGVIIILMGLFIAVTTIWHPTVLMPLMRDRRFLVRPDSFGPAGPVVMGAAFAFGWTPCIGPFLSAALALAANTETTGRAMLVLAFYSLGLGIPFLVAAVAVAGAYSRFDGLKRFVRPISVISGLIMVGFGVLLITGDVYTLNNWFYERLKSIGLDGLAEV